MAEKQIELLLSKADIEDLLSGLDEINVKVKETTLLEIRLSQAHAELCGAPVCDCGTQKAQKVIGYSEYTCPKCSMWYQEILSE